MMIDLNRESPEPLYMQISNQIRKLILSGDLPDGTRLPPERSLAASLGINRTTVSTAYQELAADGLVRGQVGRGTVICARPRPGGLEYGELYPQLLPWPQCFVNGGQGQDLLVRDLVALCAQEDVISLAAGVPDPDLYPVERFAQATDAVLRRDGRALLQHCPTEGHQPFLETLAEFAAARQIAVSADHILVLAGSQQGLDLVARALIAPGDAVVVEDPTYLGALTVFRGAGARLLPVPMDDQGMRVDILERMLARHRPQLIYTLPTYQNPSGTLMSYERRIHLLSLAQRYQVPVLEDDPYSELYFGDPPPPPIKALDDHGHVIYLSTYSKILFPGVRIGWMAAPRPVVERLVTIKQNADLHSNTLAQWALTEFMQAGWLAEHLATVRQAYPRKCQTMIAALDEHVSEGVRWNAPGGGIYLWCHLRPGLRAKDLLAEASLRRVAFVAGEAFHARGTEQESFRLNFTYNDASGIQEGVRRLAGALEALQARVYKPRVRRPAARPIV
jgi:DNA-binding transcriptional MocR family regulator